MSAELEHTLAEMLNMGTEETKRSLGELVAEIRKLAEGGKRVLVPRLGVFEIVDGELGFEPDADLESYVNAEFAGLKATPVDPEAAERLREALADESEKEPVTGELDENELEDVESGVAPEVLDDSNVEVLDTGGVWTEKIDSSHADELLGEDAGEEADFTLIETPDIEAEELAVLQALGGTIPNSQEEPAPVAETETPEQEEDTTKDITTGQPEKDLAPEKDADDSESPKEVEITPEDKEEESKTTVEPIPKASDRTKNIHHDAMRERRRNKRKEKAKKESRRAIAIFGIVIVALAAAVWFGLPWIRGLVPPAGDEEPATQMTPVLPDTVAEQSAVPGADSLEVTEDGDSLVADVPVPVEQQPSEQTAPSDPIAPRIPSSDGNYAWIVASSPSRASVEGVLQRYLDAGAPGEIVSANVDGRVVYRAAIGRYANAEAALAGKSTMPDFAPDDMWIRNIGPQRQ